MMAARTDLRALEREAAEAIRAAFPDLDPLAETELESTHCEECQDVSAMFRGKRWTDVTTADLAGNPPVSLLNVTAFVYFLPALMLRSVEAPEQLDCVPTEVLGALSPPNGKPSRKLAEVKRRFSLAQRAAVRAFLAVCETREKIDEYPPEAFDSVPASKPLARAIAYWSCPDEGA